MKRHVTVVLAGSLASVASAQTHGSGEAPEPTRERFFDTELNITGDHAFSANVDGGGDVSVTRAMGMLWLAHSFSPTLRLSLQLSEEASWYDFSNATGLIAGSGRPFSQLLETDIAPGVSVKLNDRWTALGGAFFRFAGEGDADVGDSFTWGGYAAASYRASKDFSITLGVRVNDRLEEDRLILPAVALDWNVSQTVRVQFIPAVGGAGFRVTSAINDRWSFLIDGEYQRREFRLNDEAPLPEGIVRDSRAMIGVGVVYKPTDKIELTARAGAVVWQEFRIDDRDGNQLATPNTDPAPYIFIGGKINF
ncbi:MAG: TonB-dependent receptor [Phycisphaerales bacterium]|nr:TonB-dependent receptor [Phycisphaerales bacterium]